MVGSGCASDQFFSFSLVFCVLAGLIVAICIALAAYLTTGEPLDLNRMGLAAVTLTLALLLVSHAVRALILAGLTLHRRIRSPQGLWRGRSNPSRLPHSRRS